MIRSSSRYHGVVALFSLLLILVGCSSDSEPRATTSALDDDAITIASFDFPESELLAETYAQALEAKGFEVRRAFGLGPREFVQPALSAGLVEFVPEYAGTALEFVSLGQSRPVANVDATYRSLVRSLKKTSLVALTPAPAQDANAFVVTRQTAERYDLRNVSDLKSVAARLTFGGPPECPTRPFCLRGLERVYGITFSDFLALDAGGPITHDALKDRHVDIALVFTTDPRIADGDLVALGDDRQLQPAENVTPLVRTEIVKHWGSEFEQPINSVSRRLTTSELRSLNAQVARGNEVGTVARAWLTRQGLP